MAWFLVPVIAILLLAVPYFAADSRDGADWKPAALGRARGTRRALTFSQSPGVSAVRKLASSAFASHRRARRARKTERTRPAAKIGGALVDRFAER
jgi:hypothetical protein